MRCGPEQQQRCGTWFSPCFELHETKELTLRFEEEGRLAPETSHAGIIRIGFEGISQPHFVEHPCFNNLIETLTARFRQTGLARRAPAHALKPRGSPCPAASRCRYSSLHCQVRRTRRRLFPVLEFRPEQRQNAAPEHPQACAAVPRLAKRGKPREQSNNGRYSSPNSYGIPNRPI